MNIELDHLSYSSISSFLSCGQAWKYHYLDKLPTSTSPELIFGTAFHGTVETFVQEGSKGDLLTLWQQKWQEAINTSRSDISWEKGTPEEYCNQGVRMFNHPDIQQGILSIKAGQDETGPMIERKVELHVPGVPVPVIGYIDIITADGVPGDFKTSAKSWSADKALDETQPLFYLAALNQLGIHVPNLRFRHFVFVKTKTPQFQMLEHTHTRGQMLWLFSMIRKVWESIDHGCFPMNPTGWKCNPQYCDYWSICRGKNG